MHIDPKKASNMSEIAPYEYNVPDIVDRIEAMAGNHEFIEFLFRDYDNALLTYRESALILLDGMIKSLNIIRQKLSDKGATEEQLKRYDDKIKKCFSCTMRVIQNRIDCYDDFHPLKELDENLLASLKAYNISIGNGTKKNP